MANVQRASHGGKAMHPPSRNSRKSKARIEHEGLTTIGNITVFEAGAGSIGDLQSCGYFSQSGTAELKSFEFVTINQPADAAGVEFSKTVHTQAMRDYLRRQTRQPITGIEEVVTSVKPEEPALYKGRFKLNTWSHKTRTKVLNARRQKGLALDATTRVENDNAPSEVPRGHRSPIPVVFLDERRLNPFDSLAIKLGRRSEGLLLHYHHSYSMNSTAINPDGDFFSHARADPALLHSILYLVALHHDLKLGRSDSPECLYHGGKAFRMINQRLQDGIFSDMTIAAVAMLVTKENLNGNYAASKIHMRGLRNMVAKRGGILSIKGVFSRIVTWSDFCYSNVWNCQPRFPLLPSSPSLSQSTPSSPDKKSSLLAPAHIFGSTSPIVPIFINLRTLSGYSSPPDRRIASGLIYTTEYALLALKKPQPNDLEPTECLYAFEAIPLKTAAYLYLYTARDPAHVSAHSSTC